MNEPSEDSQTAANGLNWIILKVHQRCNLDCTYCYVYNRGDDSWRHRPKQLSDAVLQQVARRIDEQAACRGFDEFVVELHGGEPLLVGKRRMREIIENLMRWCRTPLRFLLQTNGTLLDEEWARLFGELHVSVGISIDGPPESADRRRRFRNGRGSSTRILLDRLAKLREISDLRFEYGTLTVVDPSLNGAALIDWFVDNGFDSVDFLLPLGNLANLPDDWRGAAPYRDFLLSAFERWLELDGRAPNLRLFETIIRSHLGMRARLDALGGDLGALCVVETNGAIGISDVIRLCGGRWAEDSVTVFDIPFAEHAKVLDVDLVQAPAAKCLACPQFRGCGGGYVPHRYNGSSFANPSLYCDALYALSERAEQEVRAALPPTLIRSEKKGQVDAPLAA